MADNRRPVHFLEVVEVDQNDQVHHLEGNDFWNYLWDHAKTLGEDRLDLRHRGTTYVGRARETVSPAAKYFHIGRRRFASDYPEIETDDETPESLSLDMIAGNPKGLLEPAFLRPISGTNCIAALRTTGAPSWSAIQTWLNDVSGWIEKDRSLELIPVVRDDADEKLHLAESAARVHVKLAGDADLSNPDGELEQALEVAQRAGSRTASVELKISYGRSLPDLAGGGGLLSGLKSIRRNPGLQKLQATLIHANQSTRNYDRDTVDFIKDKVTAKVAIGDGRGTQTSHSDVMHGLSSAIDGFRAEFGGMYRR